MSHHSTPLDTNNAKTKLCARFATLDELLQNVVPLFVAPTPQRETFRDWLDRANVPRFKANPVAKRGGGPCFYSVSAVEKFFRQRTSGVNQ
jgi:hypothetical protein